MKGRKFSFDIPRLKIGPVRPGDPRGLKADAFAFPLDSPLEPPKSVRPPLPPHVEADLRAACAYVLQNFKPSHVVFNEQYRAGKDEKHQLDYAAVKAAAAEDKQQLDSAAVRKDAPSAGATVAARTAEIPTELGDFVSEDPGRYRYRPDVNKGDLVKHMDRQQIDAAQKARLRAEQLMGGMLLSSEIASPSSRDRKEAHRRSKSMPLSSSSGAATIIAPAASGPLQQPPMPRTNSTETTRSTPFSDSSDYPWTNTTAPSSAAVASTRSSKHASTQAFHAELEGPAVRKAEHRNDSACPGGDRQPAEGSQSAAVATATLVHLPPRKPFQTKQGSVENPRQAAHQKFASPSPKSRDENLTALPPAKKIFVPVHQPTQDQSIAGIERGRTNTDARGRRRSCSRDVKNVDEPREHQRRGRSTSREVYDRVRHFFRPPTAADAIVGSDTAARSNHDAIYDPPSRIHRSQSRESFSSVRSAASNMWRPKWARQGGKAVESDQESSSLDINAKENKDTGAARGGLQSKRKPINLNRELPPLPSLQTWDTSQRERSKPRPAPHSESQTAQADDAANHYAQLDPTRNNSQAWISRSPSRPRQCDADQEGYSLEPTASLAPIAPTSSINPDAYSRGRSRSAARKRADTAASAPYARTESVPESSRVLRSKNSQPNLSSQFRNQTAEMGLEYERLMQSQYKNIAEISVTPGADFSAEIPPKQKIHWWQKKAKKPNTWVNEFAKSNANAGVVAEREGAGAPFVRY